MHCIDWAQQCSEQPIQTDIKYQPALMAICMFAAADKSSSKSFLAAKLELHFIMLRSSEFSEN